MHDYDFGGILQGMLEYCRYRDHVVLSTSWDGQNTMWLDVKRPGGGIVRAEITFKVL